MSAATLKSQTVGADNIPVVWVSVQPLTQRVMFFFLFLLPYLESAQTVVLCRFWLQCSRGLRRPVLTRQTGFVKHIVIRASRSAVTLLTR